MTLASAFVSPARFAVSRFSTAAQKRRIDQPCQIEHGESNLLRYDMDLAYLIWRAA